MKIAKGLKKTEDGRFTCSIGKFQRHFKVIMRFVIRTDAVAFITRKGKNNLVLMSYKHYIRMSVELKKVNGSIQRIPYSSENR